MATKTKQEKINELKQKNEELEKDIELAKMKLAKKNGKAKVGDVIHFQGNVCFVEKAGAKGVIVLESKDSTPETPKFSCYKNINFNSRTFDVLLYGTDVLSKELKDFYDKTFMSLSKGDYVSFIEDGEKQFGTVVKGGKKPTVLCGDFEIKGSASIFTVEKQPEVEIPEELKEWSFVGYKEHKQLSEETLAFNVTVKRDKKKVFAASNRGHGGCMEVHAVVGDVSPWEHSKAFEQAVKDSIVRLYPDESNRPSMTEMDESYILWYNVERKLNIQWVDFLKSYIW